MYKKMIYALGFFDGVHLGHQALLRACRVLAEQHGCTAGAVTFTAHPDGLVSGQSPALINTARDRTNLLCAFGAESVLELPFDRALMTTHWSSFLQQLVAADAAGFVCGDDFLFGAGGLGTTKKLAAFCEKRGLPYAVVPQQALENVRISSTHIRALLEQGDVETANRFLGHPHILSGTVVQGKQLGRTIGIPTANLAYPAELAELKRGVYACKAYVEGNTYLAVTNIGTRPTVDGQGVNIEAHLLDYEGDLYGKPMILAFYAFLRPEQKFTDLETLQAQIAKDIATTRRLVENGELRMEN